MLTIAIIRGDVYPETASRLLGAAGLDVQCVFNVPEDCMSRAAIEFEKSGICVYEDGVSKPIRAAQLGETEAQYVHRLQRQRGEDPHPETQEERDARIRAGVPYDPALNDENEAERAARLERERHGNPNETEAQREERLRLERAGSPRETASERAARTKREARG